MECFGLFFAWFVFAWYFGILPSSGSDKNRSQDAQSGDRKYTHTAHWYFVQLDQFWMNMALQTRQNVFFHVLLLLLSSMFSSNITPAKLLDTEVTPEVCEILCIISWAVTARSSSDYKNHFNHHLSNDKIPGCLGRIGDYSAQIYENYNQSL